MLLCYAVPPISVTPYSLKIGLKAVLKLLGTVVVGRFIKNHRMMGMMHGYVRRTRFEMAAILHPKFAGTSVHDDSLVTIFRILIPAILRILKKGNRRGEDADQQANPECFIHNWTSHVQNLPFNLGDEQEGVLNSGNPFHQTRAVA